MAEVAELDRRVEQSNGGNALSECPPHHWQIVSVYQHRASHDVWTCQKCGTVKSRIRDHSGQWGVR
jgi:hypothetical protein